MSEALDIILAIKPILGAFLCLVGAVLAIIGTVGVLRFPDFYTRLHAASIIDTGSATILIVGMALLAPTWLVVFKLAAIWLFLFLTGPTGSHALANAAHTAGLQPVIGRRTSEPEDGEVN
ncbi:monovalent cation/H(+) antiporter subunit G [Henriciella sp. AS95]|uniref:monovalent cation/H(+) antiporter subunit G n=1 Tax=Henriciella sp. AS95 TaxID=3135782 RepID=UPI00316EE7F1